MLPTANKAGICLWHTSAEATGLTGHWPLVPAQSLQISAEKAFPKSLSEETPEALAWLTCDESLRQNANRPDTHFTLGNH